ncbi:septal ring lytic transglycosylase RlpA family protein [Alkalicella caledoniensis]|uniref:Probable endolytic peptidoglycan transglycosylase RlpA n=1 Tax=Alkalicella caledoniensis TaxID=2731377 RepID=A0A7G9W817_ALKCA|nr:septal ring lytic transglycosylase RlpA family protein [Alkalicella caledoniensis]QNO14829.1 septal ring lytic transglycosylase RlpA family protein [Alkalicella caledoniensis]
MTMIGNRTKDKKNMFSKKIKLIISSVVLLLSIVILAGLNQLQVAGHKSIITIFTSEGFTEITTDKTIVAEILAEANIVFDENYQKVYPSIDEEVETDYITIVNGASVLVKVDGEDLEIITWSETVEDLLAELSIELDEDIISLSLDEIVKDGQQVEIVRVQRNLVYEEVPIPTQTTYRNDSSLALGKEQVQTQAKEGAKKVTYEVVFNDGVQVSKTKVSEEVITEPVIGVVLRGTQALASRSGSRETNASVNTGTTNATEGIASFYGSELHGNYTASGVRFDMNAFTAAHNTYPFGTKVKVTYLATGKSVIVVINDRGPHVANRIIDLSAAAAKEIGLYSAGIGRVRIEVVK